MFSQRRRDWQMLKKLQPAISATIGDDVICTRSELCQQSPGQLRSSFRVVRNMDIDVATGDIAILMWNGLTRTEQSRSRRSVDRVAGNVVQIIRNHVHAHRRSGIMSADRLGKEYQAEKCLVERGFHCFEFAR